MKTSNQILASRPALARVVQFSTIRTFLPTPSTARLDRLTTLSLLVSQLPAKDVATLADIAARLVQANKAAER